MHTTVPLRRYRLHGRKRRLCFIVDRLEEDEYFCGTYNVYPRNVEEAIYLLTQRSPNARSSALPIPITVRPSRLSWCCRKAST